MDTEKPKNIKQVHLPSGKVIEVVTFSDLPHAPHAGDLSAGPGELDAPTRSGAESTEKLHVCPCCAGDLVFPLDWAEAGPAHWEVSLRCPECEWIDRGVFSQKLVERFDIELDRGAEVLLRDLQQLAHANMAEDVERFTRALHADLIVPADF